MHGFHMSRNLQRTLFSQIQAMPYNRNNKRGNIGYLGAYTNEIKRIWSALKPEKPLGTGDLKNVLESHLPGPHLYLWVC